MNTRTEQPSVQICAAMVVISGSSTRMVSGDIRCNRKATVLDGTVWHCHQHSDAEVARRTQGSAARRAEREARAQRAFALEEARASIVTAALALDWEACAKAVERFKALQVSV